MRCTLATIITIMQSVTSAMITKYKSDWLAALQEAGLKSVDREKASPEASATFATSGKLHSVLGDTDLLLETVVLSPFPLGRLRSDPDIGHAVETIARQQGHEQRTTVDCTKLDQTGRRHGASKQAPTKVFSLGRIPVFFFLAAL